MFERFTDSARKAIVLAMDEAQLNQQPEVREEHVFVGLITESPTNAASLTLKRLGLDITELVGIARTKIQTYPQRVDGSNPKPALSDGTKKIIPTALRESLQLNKSYIGTEHLLLSLIRSEDSFIAKTLISRGATLDATRRVVAEILDEHERSQSQQTSNPAPNLATAGPMGGRDKSGSELLDQFGRSLTNDAQEGKLDPVLDRDKEIHRLMQILSRRTKNNPILLGEAGVGKTAIIEGLAQKLLDPKAPKSLKHKQIYMLDLSLVVSGTRYRGDFEERIKKIIKEIKTRGNIVLFIDEIHTMLGAGASEGGMDAGNMLKPMLSRGEIQIVGATTQEEYRKYFAKDAAMERRFQPVEVKEPTEEQALHILKGLRDRYEEFHKVSITDEALTASVKLSARYITDRFLPDKAIDLMDEAAARARLDLLIPSAELNDANENLARIQAEKEVAITTQEFERAAILRNEEEALVALHSQLEDEWKEREEHTIPVVDDESIAQVLSDITGVPVTRMTEAENRKLIRMERELTKRVIGQKEAVHALSRSIRRVRAGIKDPNRPSGSFIFAGPTGVGKTELVKTLAEFLYGDENQLIRFDMSEYSEKHTVAQLLGSPAGFVGYEDSGRLTREVKKKPNSVILFDEIEKAHPEIFNVFLQILDEGSVTDAQGTKIDFKNTTIIMTTNIGTKDITNGPAGFTAGTEESNYEHMVKKVRSSLKNEYRPEFLNRVDEVIVFHHLTKENTLSIVDLIISKLQKLVTEQGITINVDNAAKEKLTEDGFDKSMGARPLRRTIQRHVEDVISELVLLDMLPEDKVINISVRDGKFIYNDKTDNEIEMEFEVMEEVERVISG